MEKKIVLTPKLLSLFADVLVKTDAAQLALAGFCEGKGIGGKVQLVIDAAHVVPIPDPAPPLVN